MPNVKAKQVRRAQARFKNSLKPNRMVHETMEMLNLFLTTLTEYVIQNEVKRQKAVR